MYSFLIYILKVSLSLAVFYLFYKLLCSRDTLHRFNRLLLLVILALSAAIPFMHFDFSVAGREASIALGELAMAINPTEMKANATAAEEGTLTLWRRIPWQQIPWRAMLVGLYLIGLAFYLTRFAASLASIVLLIRKSKQSELPDGTILITHDKAYGPFSWMRYIIVSEKDLHDNCDMILAHERAHIHLGHSWDLLFAQWCATAQWFNPAAWLLKHELEAIHEYEADKATLNNGFDARQYQLRLFEAATGVKFNTITNNFNNCSTKKRIIMMMKKQTSPWARMKALFMLPVAFAVVAVISCTSPKDKKVENTTSEVAVASNEQDEILPVADELPMFPGGMQEMIKFLQQEIKYPEEAMEKKIQGRVVVQFVVNKDGSICNDTVVRSIDPLLDAEAVRVIHSMPNWEPGKQDGQPVRVRFTMPISFKLNE